MSFYFFCKFIKIVHTILFFWYFRIIRNNYYKFIYNYFPYIFFILVPLNTIMMFLISNECRKEVIPAMISMTILSLCYTVFLFVLILYFFLILLGLLCGFITFEEIISILRSAYSRVNNNVNREQLPIQEHKNKEVNDIGIISKGEEFCCICFTNRCDTVLRPCNHNQYCHECVKHISICALCRAPIRIVNFLKKPKDTDNIVDNCQIESKENLEEEKKEDLSII